MDRRAFLGRAAAFVISRVLPKSNKDRKEQTTLIREYQATIDNYAKNIDYFIKENRELFTHALELGMENSDLRTRFRFLYAQYESVCRDYNDLFWELTEAEKIIREELST